MTIALAPEGALINVSSPQARGLVAAYPLNDWGALDVVGGLHPETITGTSVVTTQSGRGRYFNGSQYVTIGDRPELYFPDDFSVSFWLTVKMQVDTYEYVIADYNTAANLCSIAINIQNNSFTGWVTKLRFFWENPSGIYNPVMSDTVLDIDKLYHVVCVADNDGRHIYIDGVFEATNSTAQARNDYGGAMTFGRCGNANILYSNVILQDVRFYNRALSNSEIKDLYINPNDLYFQYDDYLAYQQALSSLIAENGGFSLSGGGASLLSDRTASGGSGGFSLSGGGASLLSDRIASGGSGGFSLSGGGASLLSDKVLPVLNGSISVSGNSVNILRDSVISGQTNNFTLSGKDAGLFSDRAIMAQSDLFAVSGKGANIFFDRALTGQSGLFSLTGSNSELLMDLVLSGNSSAFVVSGMDATLIYTSVGAFVLAANNGLFSLTGQSLGLLLDRGLVGGNGAFVVANSNTSLLTDRLLNGVEASFSMSGQSLSLLADRVVSASSGDLLLSGNSTGLFVNREMLCESGVFLFNGQSATLIYTPAGSYVLTASGGIFSVSGSQMSVLVDRYLGVDSSSFSVSGNDSALWVTRAISGESGSHNFSGQEASLLVGKVVSSMSGGFTLTGRDATLTIIQSDLYKLPSNSTRKIVVGVDSIKRLVTTTKNKTIIFY